MKTKTTLALTLTASAALLSTAPITQAANLLIDPGFEDPTNLQGLGTTVSSFPANQGKWGTENGVISTTQDGVTPLGTTMLSMQPQSSHTQTFQFTNLSSYAADIAAGNATFNMSAMYNTGGPHNATAYIEAQFYTASGWGSTVGSAISGSLVLDNDPNTWEQISASGAIPVGAVWMHTQVLYRGDTMDSSPGFVDNASLEITNIPEPSSTALLGLGGIGLILRRKRVS